MVRDSFHITIAVWVIKENKILLGLRQNSFSAGNWGPPGGHLEFFENAQQAAARELFEETNMVCNNFTFLSLVNDPHDDFHYFHINFIANDIQGEPEVKEPDLCVEWKWFPLNKLPDNMMPAQKRGILTYLNNENFVDY